MGKIVKLKLNNMKTTMKKDHIFYFGKYKGKTVQEVLNTDIEYIKWCEKEKGIKFDFKTPLIETIEITKRQDNWVLGKMANLSFTAKVLDKKDKTYGIDGGRVIKLEIKDNYKKEDVVLYDRGFELKPKKEYQKSYNAILKKLNN